MITGFWLFRSSPSFPVIAWPLLLQSTTFFIITEGVRSIALHHGSHACLTTNIRETLDSVAIGILYEVQRVIKEVVVFQGNCAFLVDDQGDGTMHTTNPIGEIFSITYSCRKTHELDVRRRANDGLLPHRAAANIT